MVINKKEFNKILESLYHDNLIIGFFCYNQEAITDILSLDNWDQILNIYNNKYKTTHSMKSLEEFPFFLLNTYILPAWFFTRLQNDIKSCLPAIFKLLDYNMRHIGGTLERFNSLIIACAIKEGIVSWTISDAITEDRTQTIIDPSRHNLLKSE
jgi:hypothetical protein